MEELLYIDTVGLQRLFSQIGETIPKAFSEEVSSSVSKTSALHSRIDLGGSFLGFKFGGTGDLGRGGQKGQKISQEREWLPENQMSAVKAALRHAGRLHHDVYSAINSAKATQGSAFCELNGIFKPFKWDQAGDEWQRSANRNKKLLLESDSDPDLRVGMSFAKIVFGGELTKISPTGHLGMRLSRPIGLRILGTIDSGKYVKPYAASFIDQIVA